jgi:hypothetical protein
MRRFVLKSPLSLLFLFSLALVGCSKSGDAPEVPKTAAWSKAQLDSNQAACETTLKDDSIDEEKIKPICTCWVTAIAKDFTPEEADSRSNVDPIVALLNKCGEQNGLTTNLAFLKDLFRSFIMSRNPADESHVSAAVAKALERVKAKREMGDPGDNFLSAMQKPLESMIGSYEGTQFRRFRVPIPTQDFTDEHLGRISKPNSKVFDPMEKSVEERLHFLADKIEAGEPISDKLRKEYDEAMAFLYKDVKKRVPSVYYQMYLTYETKRKKLIETLHKALTEREQRVIGLEIRRLDDEIRLNPKYHEMEIAIYKVSRIEREMELSNVNTVRARLSGAHQPQHLNIQEIAKGKAGWTLFSMPADASGGIIIDGKSIGSHVNKVKCNIVRINVSWPSIHNSVIGNGKWKSTEWKISDGDASTDSPKELVPRLAEGIVLGEKFELHFDNENAANSVKNALKTGKKVSIAGMDVTADQVDFPSANVIQINPSRVIGLYDRPVSKIPQN